jgi:sec-independent protein translocase protein TatC
MFNYLLAYFHQSIPQQGQLIFTQPMEGFMFWFKIGIFAGLFVASPFIFAQLWFFVAPGLYAREKKVVIPFVFFSTVLFLGGAAFSHFVAFPMMWKFFGSFANNFLAFMPTIKETFGFYMKMVLAIGLVFQMPMLVFFLARFGIVTAKFLLKKFKYAVLIIFIAAAVITPSSDMVSQTVLAAPMIVLYIVSIGVAWIFGKKKRAVGAE